MYQRILVPTDGSALSQKAVDSAIEQASSSGAELVALHIVPAVHSGHFDGTLRSTATHASRIEGLLAAKGQSIIDGVKAAAAKSGIDARGVLAHSDEVGDAIITAAMAHRCDLIVMASHGRQGIDRVLFGSQAEHVLANSKVPVLVLR